MAIRRVGVIMGGSSGERQVSLSTGRAISAALEDRGHHVVPLVLEAGSDWSNTIRQARIDVAFLALHGRFGEDGCIQGLLEIMGIPYTGSGVMASALAMDKVKAKELFRQHNVPTPPYFVFTADDDLMDIEEIHGSFGFPAIVKPRGEGSSLGVRKCRNISELVDGINTCLELDDVVLVERFIKGREVNVGVLDGRVLGAIEIAPKNEIYDYEAKYTPGMTEYFMPARLPSTRYLGVLNLAESAVKSLGCSGACRVDLLVTEDENEYVLEVNTLPGMTQTSLLPKIAFAAGYEFADLCESILRSARLHASARRQVQREVRHNSETEIRLHTVAVEPLAKAV